MRVVVDTNIAFSAIITPTGTISDLILNSEGVFDYWAPSFLLTELDKYQKKLLDISGMSEEELEFLKRQILHKFEFIDTLNIPKDIRTKAFEICHDIDEFDTPFVALAMGLDAKIWSGDKKLMDGLNKKGLDICLDSKSMAKLRAENQNSP